MSQSTTIDFTISEQVYNLSASIESNCNGIQFINIGNDTVTVKGYPIIANASFAPPCNVGEKDVTNYICSFAGVGTNPALLVLRKNYINR
jgi:hypothetical protein